MSGVTVRGVNYENQWLESSRIVHGTKKVGRATGCVTWNSGGKVGARRQGGKGKKVKHAEKNEITKGRGQGEFRSKSGRTPRGLSAGQHRYWSKKDDKLWTSGILSDLKEKGKEESFH